MMIKKKDLKDGMFLLWESIEKKENGFPFWSVPCLVIKVFKSSLKVRVLCDHKESLLYYKTGLRNILDEMRICSLNEVRKYFEERKKALNINIEMWRNNIRRTEEELSVLEIQDHDFLKKMEVRDD